MLGERLKRFRVARGLSLIELAAAIENAVSPQTLSKYERGTAQPSMKVLLKLAGVFGVKSARLWAVPPCQVEWVAFRKQSGLRKKEQARIKAVITETVEKRTQFQEDIGEYENVDIPLRSMSIRTIADAEDAARTLRDAMHLGVEPIANLTECLENHHIHVIPVTAHAAFDGVSAIVRETDGTVLTTAIATRTDISGDRQRLNIAHELGHLVLDVPECLDSEKAAFRFGDAFLAPAVQLRREVGQKRTDLEWEELLSLKKRYGMSVQALLFRFRDLQVITEAYYKRWCMTINSAGLKKQEPCEIPPEQPKRFQQQVHRACAEALITERDAAYLLDRTAASMPQRPPTERERFLALPKAERDRILSEQALEMADFYENDEDWKDWQGGPILEYYDTP